jgi:hypothetical protein
MSKILVAVTPLAGHVKPMLPVAQQLVKDGHQVYFQTSDNFSAQVEAAGLQFLPLLGNANYDYHQLGELIPELRTAASPWIRRLSMQNTSLGIASPISTVVFSKLSR